MKKCPWQALNLNKINSLNFPDTSYKNTSYKNDKEHLFKGSSFLGTATGWETAVVMDILGDSEILIGTYEAFVLGYKLAEDAVRSGQYKTQLSVSILQERID